MLNAIKKFFGSNSTKNETDTFQDTVDSINALEESISMLSDDELKNKTNEFRERLSNGETLDDLLIETFAVVREVSKRVLNMRHYDVQLIGGIALHKCCVAEMATGEGKTLVATLPVYLNALEGKGVHVVTVNDYLAERDAEWMGQIYKFLGLTVGILKTTSTYNERKEAYDSDITYGTSSEFAFDYIRDMTALSLNDKMQRELNFAIVDEVDSILIDFARSPLYLSGETNKPTDLYDKYNLLANKLEKDVHYKVDLKEQKLSLTDEGIEEVEELLQIDNLYDPENIQELFRIENAIYAKEFLLKDRDYIIQNNEMVLIDMFTGRLMHGRRLKEGVHQAVQAKEGLKITPEIEIKGSITYQNFFVNYKKLSGMTGTAKTEEAELIDVYHLFVISIPTCRTVTRKDMPDVIFKTEQKKNEAIVEDVIENHELGRPVLIGTPTVNKSEEISLLLTERNIPHEVLNAKNHKREAEIIAMAGEKDRITIITNMAGRGTDIKLGEGVAELGGLHVIGTTRHESRRIDNQLRGRAGRQGDPGTTRFYVSLEDEFLVQFGGSDVKETLDKLNFSDDTPIDHSLVSKLINKIQTRCESEYFEIRKYVRQYDDIVNQQRKIIEEQRNEVLTVPLLELKDKIFGIYNGAVDELINSHLNKQDNPENWNLEEFVEEINKYFFEEDHFTVDMFKEIMANAEHTRKDEISDILREFKKLIFDKCVYVYERKEKFFNKEQFALLMRNIVLKIVDKSWREHIVELDYIKKGIGLQAMCGKKPLLEYSFQAFELFQESMKEIKLQTLQSTIKLEIKVKKENLKTT